MKIYHYPQCLKSAKALELLQEKNVSLEIIEYVESPPTKEEIEDMLKKLGLSAMDVVRTHEPVWQEKFSVDQLSFEEVLDAIVAHPVLLRRPIVVDGDRALIGRPPEKVLELL